jgi:hypothetical protein
MRFLVWVAIAAFGSLPASVRAEDASPVAGKLPDNQSSQQTYLFSLKKNGISLRISPGQFCHDLGYGAAVKRSDDTDGTKGYWESGKKEWSDDGKQMPAELVWVICQMPIKPPIGNSK